MDLYRSNANFLNQEIIDNYESLIWTDRFEESGEFQLTVPWTPLLATELRARKYLKQSESKSIMMVETAILERPSANRKENLVKITGRSLEAFFENRSSKSSTTEGREPELRTGSRAQIVCSIINDYCIAHPTAVNNIPNLSIADDPPGGPSVTLTIERGPLAAMITDILRPSNLGWRVQGVYVNDVQTPGLIRFEVYNGLDRTIPELHNTPLSFSPNEENLTDISTLESIASLKNHARMVGAKTGVNVYTEDWDPGVSGLDRRTIVVDATDIGADSTTTIAEDQAALTLRGLEILNAPENKYQLLVDGDAMTSNDSTFQAVGLGDTIWISDSNGVKSKVRIAEKVWTSDSTGEKRLPTFEAV